LPNPYRQAFDYCLLDFVHFVSGLHTDESNGGLSMELTLVIAAAVLLLVIIIIVSVVMAVVCVRKRRKAHAGDALDFTTRLYASTVYAMVLSLCVCLCVCLIYDGILQNG